MFSYNSKFNQIIGLILDCLFLCLLWLVSSVPVVTAGAATTALYHTVDKVLRREEGSIWKEYWRVFRRDFKRATALWGIMLLIFAVLAANFYAAFSAGIENENLQIALQAGALFLTALMAIWLQYWFPYLSRFDDSVKTILKNTMAIMMAETKTSIQLLLLAVVVAVLDVILSKYVPVLTIAMPVAYISELNRILERLFARYIARQEATETENSTENVHE